jgi:hypothetical protein
MKVVMKKMEQQLAGDWQREMQQLKGRQTLDRERVQQQQQVAAVDLAGQA